MAALNVIIPMGGLGTRFLNEGYRFPKPLVNIVGRPMLFWLLDHLQGLSSSDVLWLAVSAHIDAQFGLVQRVRTEFPHLDVRSVLLTFDTRGAAETLYTVLQCMTEEELQRPTLSLDCDTLYFEPIVSRFRALPRHLNASFYFEDREGKAIFSYLHIDDSAGREDGQQRITAVREKVMISSWANTGAYAFCSAAVLRRYCAAVLDDAVGEVGEYYTTNIMQRMMDAQQPFTALRVHHSGFTCVGTPRQLQEMLRSLRLSQQPINGVSSGGGGAQERKEADGSGLSIIPPTPAARGQVLQPARRMRFCFDLDNTLVTYPHVAKDYSSVQPIVENITLLRELHAQGHHIIIQTARRMKTHNGNVGAVIADVGSVTLQTLERFRIPYDELHFGKPYADVYVDDLAVHALLDTAKEIGWAVDAGGGVDPPVSPPSRGFVAARHFNTLQEVDNTIVKTAATALIAGELHFYQHIPDDIADLFPRLQRVETNTLQPPEGSPGLPVPKVSGAPRAVSSLFIDKVQAVTLSHLYVNRALTAGRLLKLLAALHRIHSSNGLRGNAKEAIAVAPSANTGRPRADTPPGVFDLYGNYAPKLAQRYSDHRHLYNALDEQTPPADDHLPCPALYQRLHDWFVEYARQGRGVPAVVIHGDPVFSNALLSSQGTITLVDMRGRVGNTLTLAGDVLYDLAKVFQSLEGYDFILHDQQMRAVDLQHRHELQFAFQQHAHSRYPSVRLSDVYAAASLLFFSLIPLHVNPRHQTQFLHCSRLMIHKAQDRAKEEAAASTRAQSAPGG